MKKQATICFLTKQSGGKKLVCLAEKKRGFRAGQVNGYGGKLEKQETPRECIIRETREEAGINLNDLADRGKIVFYNADSTFECFVYTCRKWQGKIQETEEMKPDWYPTDNIPFERMGKADPIWVPAVLQGKSVDASFYFNKNNTMRKIALEFSEE